MHVDEDMKNTDNSLSSLKGKTSALLSFRSAKLSSCFSVFYRFRSLVLFDFSLTLLFYFVSFMFLFLPPGPSLFFCSCFVQVANGKKSTTSLCTVLFLVSFTLLAPSNTASLGQILGHEQMYLRQQEFKIAQIMLYTMVL